MLPENDYSSPMNLVKLQDTKLIHRNLLHFCILTMKDQKEKNIPFTITSKRIKYLGINLPKVKLLITQSCPTFCNPMDYKPPGLSVHGVLQARILEWVAMPSSNPWIGSFQPMA